MDNGIIDVASHHSVPETLTRLQSILQEKGITVFALRPQRRSREGRPQNAADAVADIRQPKRWDAVDGCGAAIGHRSTVESSGLAG